MDDTPRNYRKKRKLVIPEQYLALKKLREEAKEEFDSRPLWNLTEEQKEYYRKRIRKTDFAEYDKHYLAALRRLYLQRGFTDEDFKDLGAEILNDPALDLLQTPRRAQAYGYFDYYLHPDDPETHARRLENSKKRIPLYDLTESMPSLTERKTSLTRLRAQLRQRWREYKYRRANDDSDPAFKTWDWTREPYIRPHKWRLVNLLMDELELPIELRLSFFLPHDEVYQEHADLLLNPLDPKSTWIRPKKDEKSPEEKEAILAARQQEEDAEFERYRQMAEAEAELGKIEEPVRVRFAKLVDVPESPIVVQTGEPPADTPKHIRDQYQREGSVYWSADGKTIIQYKKPVHYRPFIPQDVPPDKTVSQDWHTFYDEFELTQLYYAYNIDPKGPPNPEFENLMEGYVFLKHEWDYAQQWFWDQELEAILLDAATSPHFRQIERAMRKPFGGISIEERQPEQKLEMVKGIYDSGAAFFLPVLKDSKNLAWRRKLAPVSWKTIKNMVYMSDYNEEDKRRKTLKPRQLYDLSVQTGTWKMPDRDREQILIVLDVDEWDAVPPRFKNVIARNPTMTIRTKRGLHFYFWVSQDYSKSQSNGVCDWLGRGRIAVMTGADRKPIWKAPIARLSNDDAEYLYNYVKAPVEYYRRWRIGESDGLPEPFFAIQGTRNHRINGELYRMRYLSDDELTAKAVEMANQCLPPYPYSEALSTARSIIRNRHRFPKTRHLKPKSTEPQAEWAKDTSYIRLGKFARNRHDLFTRREYEAYLEQRGWKPNKDGRIAVARQDIDHHLEIGEIRKHSKRPTRGRPEIVYERMKHFDGGDIHYLPVKPSVRNIRAAIMLHLLPDAKQEVVRRSIMAHMGFKSEGTVTRYARYLSDPNQWGAPLIIYKKREPYIMTQELNPRNKQMAPVWPLPRDKYYQLRKTFTYYRPSVYQRTPAYHLILQHQQVYKSGAAFVPPIPLPSLESSIPTVIEEDKPTKPPREWKPPRQPPPPPDPPEVKRHEEAPPIVTDLEKPERHPCKSCGTSTLAKYNLCYDCYELAEEIRAARLTYDYRVHRPIEDYCEHTHRFFYTEELPLRGVHPDVEEEYFPKKPPVIFFYCPNPKCSKKVHAGFYNHYRKPTVCPHCNEFIGSAWRDKPNIPERELPGYPINHYTSTWQSIFEVMDYYWNRRIGEGDSGPFAHPGHEFEQMFDPTKLAAWREYRKSLFKMQEVTCQTCNQKVTVQMRLEDKYTKIEQCQTCHEKALAQEEVPLDIEDLMRIRRRKDYKEERERLMNLFVDYFGDNPEIGHFWDYFSIHPHEWIELALLITYKRGDYVRFPVGYIGGILNNWKNQGHVNEGDRGIFFHDSLDAYMKYYKGIPEDEVVYRAKDPYRAYDTHIEFLEVHIARKIRRAIRLYGEQAVFDAISDAIRSEVRKWNYCEAILERKARGGKIIPKSTTYSD